MKKKIKFNFNYGSIIYQNSSIIPKVLFAIALTQTTLGDVYGKSKAAFGAGGKDSTPEERAKTNERHIIDVRPNALALSRMKAELEAKGQPASKKWKNVKVAKTPAEELQIELAPPSPPSPNYTISKASILPSSVDNSTDPAFPPILRIFKLIDGGFGRA